MIPPKAGAQLVVDEIRNAGRSAVEIVVLAEPKTAPEPTEGPRPEATSRVSPNRKLETAFCRSVDFESLPILASHVIDGHAVLPMALMLEWLAEGAVHRNPGLVVCGIDNFRLFKGVILGDGQRASVEVRVGKAVRDDDHFIVPVELRGTLPQRPRGHARREPTSFWPTGIGQASRQIVEPALAPYPIARDLIYQSVLFHGPALQGIEQIEGSSKRAIAGWVSTSPCPSEWIDRPLRSTWLTDPLAIDSAFQLVVLWCSEQLGACSLPTALARYRQFRPRFPAEGARVVAEIRHASQMRALADLEFLDAAGELVARLDSYECVIDSSLDQAFRRNQLAPCDPVIPS